MTRKIDKRACRKFAMPELEFNLNEGVLHVENCPYIIRTAVRNISGQRILVLYIYQSENILAGSLKPRWVMFHSRDDFATLSFREDAKATWHFFPQVVKVIYISFLVCHDFFLSLISCALSCFSAMQELQGRNLAFMSPVSQPGSSEANGNHLPPAWRRHRTGCFLMP